MKPPIERHPYAGYAAFTCAAVLFVLIAVMAVTS